MGLRVLRWSEGLVRPCEETPSGTLELSGMDTLPVLRCNARTLHLYKPQCHHVPAPAPSPEAVLREALSKALVPYYPLAGRLIHGHSIQCAAQGVWFVAASTLQSLDAVANAIADHDEYHQLLLPTPPPHGDQPLVQIQLTQFCCGAFVIGLVFNHTVCDGLGAAQFLNAVGELARGLPCLSLPPVWSRDFHRGAGGSPPLLPPMPIMPPDHKLELATADISFEEIEKMKRHFQSETGVSCSTFELVAAALWRCRSRAGVPTLKLVFFANCRHLVEPPLPKGFYGNCFFPVSVRGEVAGARLSEVVKLIQEAKGRVREEFGKYRAGKCREDPFMQAASYEAVFVSEWGRLGFNEVDVGWGPPAQVVPIQGAPLIPAAIVGWQPAPSRGIRLTTWCVRRRHLEEFVKGLSEQAMGNE